MFNRKKFMLQSPADETSGGGGGGEGKIGSAENVKPPVEGEQGETKKPTADELMLEIEKLKKHNQTLLGEKKNSDAKAEEKEREARRIEQEKLVSEGKMTEAYQLAVQAAKEAQDKLTQAEDVRTQKELALSHKLFFQEFKAEHGGEFVDDNEVKENILKLFGEDLESDPQNEGKFLRMKDYVAQYKKLKPHHAKPNTQVVPNAAAKTGHKPDDKDGDTVAATIDTLRKAGFKLADKIEKSEANKQRNIERAKAPKKTLTQILAERNK